MRENADSYSDKSFFIGHQANLRMLQSVCSRADISADHHLFNVDQFGNCGAADALGISSQNWESFESGDEIALAVVSSGLAWGGLLIEFR